MCKYLSPPKAELSPKIWIRAGGEDARETSLVSSLPLEDSTDTYSSNNLWPGEKEHSRAMTSTRLLRQVNPDQASLG